MVPSSDGVEPWETHTPEADLDDLRTRLAAARFPERETIDVANSDRWRQGVPLADLAETVDHWRTDYEWRSFEDRLNRIGQYRTTIDGLDIHFVHRRSSRPDAVPLILTHGWPGSIVEFIDLIDELAEPADVGAQAFHVVAPSLPGFAYSGKPTRTGWGVGRIAAAWVTLMDRLGYSTFLAHGGDWGGVITTVLAGRFPDHVLGIHTTLVQAPPGLSTDVLTPSERRWADDTENFYLHRGAYAKQQATRPQTIGYALVDSPVGLLAWIMDKFAEWTDTDDTPFETIPRNRLLDDVTLYWLTGTGASAARIYYESHGGVNTVDPHLGVDVPTAISVYPADIEKCPYPWARERFSCIVRWTEPPAGGHFPSLEVPGYFVDDLRSGLTAVLAAA